MRLQGPHKSVVPTLSLSTILIVWLRYIVVLVVFTSVVGLDSDDVGLITRGIFALIFDTNAIRSGFI